MSRFLSRLDRLERLLEPGYCLYCGTARHVLLAEGEPAPPSCPACGRTPERVVVIQEEIISPAAP